YTWSVVAGSLPAGLTLNGSAINGNPTTAGTANFTLRVSDSATPTPQTDSKAFSITVSPSSVTVTTAALATGTVGTFYSQILAAGGGTPPYSWTIIFGSLPPGLTLTGATISGTPTTAGTVSFTVRATDTGTPPPQTDQKTLSITINPAPVSITTASLPAGVV